MDVGCIVRGVSMFNIALGEPYGSFSARECRESKESVEQISLVIWKDRSRMSVASE